MMRHDIGTRELPRAPRGGVLSLEVECLTGRQAAHGTKHLMTIGADGSVETPHDLAAERVAVAFGGYSSCLEIVDTAGPAVREAIGLLSRRYRPALRCKRDGRWSLQRVAECGCAGAFPTAARAAAHAERRSSGRAVPLLGEPPSDAPQGDREGRRSPTRASRRRRPGSGPEDRGRRRPMGGGLHPDVLAEMSECAAAVVDPLPTAFFLGMAYSGAFLETTTPRPDADSGSAWQRSTSPRARSPTGRCRPRCRECAR